MAWGYGLIHNYLGCNDPPARIRLPTGAWAYEPAGRIFLGNQRDLKLPKEGVGNIPGGGGYDIKRAWLHTCVRHLSY